MTRRLQNAESRIEDLDRSSRAEVGAAPHALPGKCSRFKLRSAR